MRRARKIPLSRIKKPETADRGIEMASKAASTIAGDIMKKVKLNSAKSDNGGINIHIHIGDLVMMGFDEAIDAEEWGMRENNTEINEASKPSTRKRKTSSSAEGSADREIGLRQINFRKGALELTAIEDSRPKRRVKLRKQTTRKTMRKPTRKAARKNKS